MSKFVTDDLRNTTGQWHPVSDGRMIQAGAERMGACSACRHPIKRHVGVGFGPRYMWVGACCARILCAPDQPEEQPLTNTPFVVDGREYIVPDAAWHDRLVIIAHGQAHLDYLIRCQAIRAAGDVEPLLRGGVPVYNQFAASVLRQLNQYGRITMRQYQAIERIQ